MAYFAHAVHSHPPFPADNAFSMGKKPLLSMSQEDQAMDTGHMHRKFGKDCMCGSGDILMDRQTDRQTDPQTDIFITILRNHSRG